MSADMVEYIADLHHIDIDVNDLKRVKVGKFLCFKYSSFFISEFSFHFFFLFITTKNTSGRERMRKEKEKEKGVHVGIIFQ